MRGEYSLSDIAAVTEGNGGFGGNNAWWIIILIVLLGYGRGFGGYGNGDSGNTVPFYQSLDTDFATIERKIDGVYSGICDSTFSLNNTITNGNAAIQNTLTQGFAGLNTGMVQQGYENRIAVGNVGTQLSQCCCDLKSQLADNKYETAKGFCATNNSMLLNTRDIIDGQNANTRAILDAITANKIEAKNEKIAEQNQEINALRLAASQSAQNEYLLNSLRNGCPVNAQLVCGNTPIPVQYIGAGCNCNSCGCHM